MAQKKIALHNVLDGVLLSDGINLGQLKEEVKLAIANFESFVDFTTAEPVAPATGDTYINTTTGTSNVTAQAVTADNIYEWNGTDWTDTTPEEGTLAIDANQVLYVWDGSAWELYYRNFEYVTDYYVSSDHGSDSYNGLSEKNAFSTLGAALDAGEAGAVPFAIHILDDATYTVTEASGTPGVRATTQVFSLNAPHATIIGQGGGVKWELPQVYFNLMKIEGTNLTLGPSDFQIKMLDIHEIRNPETMFEVVPADGNGGTWYLNNRITAGTGQTVNFDTSGVAVFLGYINNMSVSIPSASDQAHFTGNGTNTVISIDTHNIDGNNTGSGILQVFKITGNARGWFKGHCIGMPDQVGGEVDTGGTVHCWLSGVNGEPLSYNDNSGAGTIIDYSWSEGLNFSKLDATTGLDLADLINVRDVSTGEQVKATLTQLQSLVSGSGTTNLGIANRTSTTLDVTSDTGTDATIPEASITEAGLLTASDKVKLNNTTGTNSGNVSLAGTPNYITIAGQVITRSLINMASHVTGILGIGNGGTGVTTYTALTAALNLFTSSLKGLVPASGGGTTNFLRADGTWAAPPSGSVFTSTVTPPQITADQNNYSPTGLVPGVVLRLDLDANHDITGLNSSGFSDRDIVTIYKVGAGDIKLKANSALSTAANRFAIDADITVKNGTILMYDATSSRWRAITNVG